MASPARVPCMSPGREEHLLALATAREEKGVLSEGTQRSGAPPQTIPSIRVTESEQLASEGTAPGHSPHPARYRPVLRGNLPQLQILPGLLQARQRFPRHPPTPTAQHGSPSQAALCPHPLPGPSSSSFPLYPGGNHTVLAQRRPAQTAFLRTHRHTAGNSHIQRLA